MINIKTDKGIKAISTVIFDMDGVIFDTERLYIESCVEIGKKYNIKDVEEACYKCIGVTSEASARIMLDFYGEDFPLEKFRDEVYELFKKSFEEKLPVKMGVAELLEFLKDREVRIAIASSTSKSGVDRELTQAGLRKYFDAIICGDMVERSKPEPDIFLKAAEVLGSNPEECIVIEDSFNGIRAAHKAGIFCFMVPDILQPDEEMQDKASVILGSLDEVRDYLKDN